MRELRTAELEMVGGGGIFGLTGIAAGLEAASVLGAVSLAYGVGYGIGTGISRLYTFIAGETLGCAWYRARHRIR